MHPDIAIPAITAAEFSGQPERRHGNRTPTLFSLLYSCMDSGQMLIGDGAVTDLSSERDWHSWKSIGHARGDHNPLYRPSWNGRAFLHYPEQVSWVEGFRFGVELETLTLEEKNYLRFLL